MVERAFIIAMIVFFIHATTWDGGIFSFIRKWIKEDSVISNPIYNCPICMSPYWGTMIYIIIFGWSNWREWIAVIGCSAGINVFSVIANYVKDYCKYRTHKPDTPKGGCC